jgi:general L-amino acid transport system substrate-binding protein
MTSRPPATFRSLALGLALSVGALFAGVANAATLETVRQRGNLICGVSQGLFGFSERNDRGEWSGFDVDFCRAIAAAIFNDPKKVSFVPLSAVERFDALKNGRIDVLSRNSTWTLEREAGLGLLFVGVNFYDGQGFMVRRQRNLISALELDKSKVCVTAGTTAQDLLSDYFTANSMTIDERVQPDTASSLRSFDTGACDAMSMDTSALYAERLKLTKPGDAMILPDIISKEPLGPVVRNDDIAWFNLVKWINFALINAEELGISSSTVDQAKVSKKPDVQRFVGAEGELGKTLGLDNDWALRAVRAVGNYAEIYERNVGTDSKLGIPRGLNQLWTMGGILYAPPMR